MDFRYDLSKPSGQQVDIKTIRVNGKKWSPLKTYTVTANAAIIALAPSLGVSINNIHLLDDFEYTVVKDYLAAQKGVVNYRSEGRILEKHIGNDEDCPEDKTVSQEFSGQKTLGEQKLPPAVYPNPFAVSTNFSFSVAKQSAVVINVYDQSGKLLSTLLNKQYQPGNYTYQWRSTNLATGVYFFSITTAEGIKTGKLIQINP